MWGLPATTRGAIFLPMLALIGPSLGAVPLTMSSSHPQQTMCLSRARLQCLDWVSQQLLSCAGERSKQRKGERTPNWESK